MKEKLLAICFCFNIVKTIICRLLDFHCCIWVAFDNLSLKKMTMMKFRNCHEMSSVRRLSDCRRLCRECIVYTSQNHAVFTKM